MQMGVGYITKYKKYISKLNLWVQGSCAFAKFAD